jgi:outer membrane protein, heavy metal efflux system
MSILVRTAVICLFAFAAFAGAAEAQPSQGWRSMLDNDSWLELDGDAEAPDRLAQLVAELEKANPRILAARREVDASVARIAPAGAPPDPTLSIGYMGGVTRPFFPSSSTAGAFQQFGASQEIPFPGKLALRTRIASADADSERWTYEEVRRRLASELKASYFDFLYTDRAIAVVRRNKELLEQFRDIAEARFRVGRGVQQDVLKAQVEISLMLERLAVLESQHHALRAAINTLLYRNVDSPLLADLAFEAASFDISLAELRQLVERNNPAVRREEQVIDRGQHALALARREVLPDFRVSFNSQRMVGEMPWMYGVDVMVSVPLFWQRKQRPLVAEAAATLESGRRMRESALSMAENQVTDGYLAVTTSRRLADLYGDSVLPQARLALESSIAAYQVGNVDFLTLLANFMTLLDYELAYEEQSARYHQALARLEPLVGLDLIR